MIAIKSLQDIEKIREANPEHYDILKEELTHAVSVEGFDPDTKGYPVYLTREDINYIIGEDNSEEAGLYASQHGIFFSDNELCPKWESVHGLRKKGDDPDTTGFTLFGVFVTLNNENLMSYYIPNESWLPSILFELLHDHREMTR